MTIEWVFLDVGGIIFRDGSYFTALYESISAVAPSTTRDAYDERLRALRAAQAEPFSEALLATFVPDASQHRTIRAAADEAWEERGHHPDELYPEALDVMRVLSQRYRLACITNHFSWIRGRADEAGFADLVGAWAISAELGVEKPGPEIFEAALRLAGTTPERAVMVGDRLDRDIMPTKALGMRTIWVIRNEAPDDPTAKQLAVPDAAVRTLDPVPEIVYGF